MGTAIYISFIGMHICANLRVAKLKIRPGADLENQTATTIGQSLFYRMSAR